jgi:glycosyltransferase involved in cell wall biosynthesis
LTLPMILFIHNRYRTTGGEERVVEDLVSLVREELGEQAQLLERDSLGLGRAKAAAALLGGGASPREVAAAVRRTGARVVHAHNLHPTLGWRSLAAAREAGARVVLHLHQYRLVCAVGVCFTGGEECLRCHGRNTLPGVLHNCRGARAEALSYAAALALWQRRLLAEADAVIVPSAFAERRLRDLGVPLPRAVEVIAPPLLDVAAEKAADAATGRYALVVSRLATEKGVDVAIEACASARRELVVAGDGPLLGELRRLATAVAGATASVGAGGGDDGRQSPGVRFVGRVAPDELERLRTGAALALVPSRSAETFGLAAAEAMAAGLPIVASAIGALPELVEAGSLVPPGEPDALAESIGRLWGDAEAGRRARSRVSELCAPGAVAAALGEVYDRVCAADGAPRRLPGR